MKFLEKRAKDNTVKISLDVPASIKKSLIDLSKELNQPLSQVIRGCIYYTLDRLAKKEK